MKYYTPEDVALLLNIEPGAIYQYIQNNFLQCIKIGANYRISHIEFKKFKRKYFTLLTK